MWMSWYKYLIFVVWFVWLDLLFKYLFYDLAFLSESAVFEPVLNIWISFSIDFNYILVYVFSGLIALVIFYLMFYNKLSRIIGALFLAWLIGNLIDRIFLWWVRDFIVFGDWFVFNLADTYLFISIVLLFWKEYVDVWKKSAILSWKR